MHRRASREGETRLRVGGEKGSSVWCLFPAAPQIRRRTLVATASGGSSENRAERAAKNGATHSRADRACRALGDGIDQTRVVAAARPRRSQQNGRQRARHLRSRALGPRGRLGPRCRGRRARRRGTSFIFGARLQFLVCGFSIDCLLVVAVDRPGLLPRRIPFGIGDGSDA